MCITYNVSSGILPRPIMFSLTVLKVLQLQSEQSYNYPETFEKA